MKKRKSKYTFSIFKKELPLHLMLLPGVLMILVFNYTTMAGLIIAFQKFIPSKGLFGDQKYLDKWTTMFDCIYVPEEPGCGVGPWNVQRFDIEKKDDGKLLIKDRIFGTESNLIFYHFANVRYIDERRGFNGFYEIPADAKKLIYAPYFKKFGEAKKKSPQPEPSLWKRLRLSPVLINLKRWNETTLRAFKTYAKCFSPKFVKKLISDMYTNLE